MMSYSDGLIAGSNQDPTEMFFVQKKTLRDRDRDNNRDRQRWREREKKRYNFIFSLKLAAKDHLP